MELELIKTCMDAFDVGAEVVLTQEETAETIVPDYCPDIARIIDTEGKVFLHRRELRDGKAELSGTVHVTVLYTPDGESGIRTLEFAIPFSAASEGRGLGECVSLCAQTETEFLETRMSNPRKVFTRCKLVSRLTGYRKAPLCYTPGVEAEPALCIQKLQETQKTQIVTQISEKDFTFSEEWRFANGKEGAAEILSCGADAMVQESKILGSKLILKGVFRVRALYRTAEGSCGFSAGELPFSQIMEVEGAAEDAAVEAQLQFTGMDFQMDSSSEDGRELAVTLYLHATALLRQEVTLTLLSDLYSTCYDVTYEAGPLQLCEYTEPVKRRQMVREVLETGAVAETLLSLRVNCGSVTAEHSADGAMFRSGVTVRALYLDEGGVPLIAERCIDVSCQADWMEDGRISASCCCPEEPQGSIGERGIEVRFPVEFQAQGCRRRERMCIQQVRMPTEQRKDLSKMPSLVLRSLGKGENLWDLAKRYSTTIPAILSANELESESQLPREKLLLIPRTRV